MSHEAAVRTATAWLREEPSLIAARIAYLIREFGVDTKNAICVKVFPDTVEPTGGVIITRQGKIFQFAFNPSGVIIERSRIEEWVNLNDSYLQHPWRDEILTGLKM